jgi:hypothetical protein
MPDSVFLVCNDVFLTTLWLLCTNKSYAVLLSLACNLANHSRRFPSSDTPPAALEIQAHALVLQSLLMNISMSDTCIGIPLCTPRNMPPPVAAQLNPGGGGVMQSPSTPLPDLPDATCSAVLDELQSVLSKLDVRAKHLFKLFDCYS